MLHSLHSSPRKVSCHSNRVPCHLTRVCPVTHRYDISGEHGGAGSPVPRAQATGGIQGRLSGLHHTAQVSRETHSTHYAVSALVPPRPSTPSMREFVGHKVLHALKTKNDAVIHAAIDMLCALMQVRHAHRRHTSHAVPSLLSHQPSHPPPHSHPSPSHVTHCPHPISSTHPSPSPITHSLTHHAHPSLTCHLTHHP